MLKEDQQYAYEKAEQLAAEVEELLNKARSNAGVESKDAMDITEISECMEEAYEKIENIEGIIDSVLGNFYEHDEDNSKGSKANYELAADMLEELKHAKKIIHESLNMLDKEDWHVEELADKINEVYVNYNYEAIQASQQQ